MSLTTKMIEDRRLNKERLAVVDTKIAERRHDIQVLQDRLGDLRLELRDWVAEHEICQSIELEFQELAETPTPT